jgi:uncharacterized membrane protein YfcA
VDTVFHLADVGTFELVLIGFVAFAASILGGLSGYGTGLVLPIFVAPVVGIVNVIPVMAVGMAISNGSRCVAFWQDIEWDHVRRVLMLGLPACLAGAYLYTLLQARWIAFALGGFLIASVALRRMLGGMRHRLRPRGETLAGGAFGFVNGGMTGTGPLLISILMSAGIAGASLIATDAVVSLVMGMVKIATFGGLSRLDADLAVAGLLIGACTAPGAFVARWLLARIPARIHATVMEVVVLIGGAAFIWRGAVGS